VMGDDARMGPPNESGDAADIDVDEGKRRIDAGAILLDVREPDEWHAGHAENALWIPMGEVAARQQDVPDDRPIVVICRVGSRSARVANALVRGGFDAVNLAGGMRAWAAAGFPVVTDDGATGDVI
jgi:rhodanese-related sulfurtransferase